MAVKILIITFFCLRLTTSQYYGQPPSPYQPGFYPLQQPMYPTEFASPPQCPYPASLPQFPFPQSPNPFVSPNQCPGLPHPSYVPPFPYNPASAVVPLNFALYPPMPNYPPTYPQAYPTSQYPTYQNTAANKSVPIKLPPNTAVYYLAKELPKAVEAVEENNLEAPEYTCPYCNGFADVPKSSKLAPPPPSTSVLPGILDKIPTITKPDVSKLEDLKELCKKPLAELLEHKLSGKLRFDEDVLDGFLTGIGFGKHKTLLL